MPRLKYFAGLLLAALALLTFTPSTAAATPTPHTFVPIAAQTPSPNNCQLLAEMAAGLQGIAAELNSVSKTVTNDYRNGTLPNILQDGQRFATADQQFVTAAYYFDGVFAGATMNSSGASPGGGDERTLLSQLTSVENAPMQTFAVTTLLTIDYPGTWSRYVGAIVTGASITNQSATTRESQAQQACKNNALRRRPRPFP